VNGPPAVYIPLAATEVTLILHLCDSECLKPLFPHLCVQMNPAQECPECDLKQRQTNQMSACVD